MYEYLQYIDFKNKNITNVPRYSFLEFDLYENVRAVEYRKEKPSTFIYFLERENTEDNYFMSDNKHYIVYGSVFTNNNYAKHSGLKPSRINAGYLKKLYTDHKHDIIKYIKGSFVIIIYEELTNIVHLLSDRLNVLPLYYYNRDRKLIISSSIRMILKYNPRQVKTNKYALIDQLVFDYILNDKTYFENIFQVKPGAIYTIGEKGAHISQYWGVDELYREELLNNEEALEQLSLQLYESVNLYASDKQKVLVSLTGGFDGRTNLSLLKKDRSDFLCYSYGIEGSKQISIPLQIAKEFNINYRPIYLDQEFKINHDNDVLEAIEFSNGTAPIIRACYPYAYKILREFSDTAITGLFGSELVRPLQNLGIMINDFSEKIFLSGNYVKAIRESIEQLKGKKYFNDDIFNNADDYLIDEFKTRYFDKYTSFDDVTKLFFFLLEEGIRKFFMQEIQIERAYITNRFPFFDDDFVDLMYQTSLAGMYKGVLKGKIRRRKGQLLYAHIINKFKPELGLIPLDRGYKPLDLLRVFPVNHFYTLKGVIDTKMYIRVKGNDTFKSEEWTIPFIKKVFNNDNVYEELFSVGLKDSFLDYSYLDDFLKYSHLIALNQYMISIYK